MPYCGINKVSSSRVFFLSSANEKASFGRSQEKDFSPFFLVFVTLNHTLNHFCLGHKHAQEVVSFITTQNGVGDDHRGRGGVEREAALVGRRARKDAGRKDVVVAETTGASTSTSSSSSRFVVVV